MSSLLVALPNSCDQDATHAIIVARCSTAQELPTAILVAVKNQREHDATATTLNLAMHANNVYFLKLLRLMLP